MTTINLITDLDLTSSLAIGIKYGFIFSFSSSLIALGINYCIQLFKS